MRGKRKRQRVTSGEAAIFMVLAIATVSLLIAGCTEWKGSAGLRGSRSGSASAVVSDAEIARTIARIRPVRGNTKSHLLLAKHYQKRDRHREAIPEFWKVLSIDPEHVEALIGMGVSYDAMENYSRAQEAFRIALKLDPTSHVAHNNLGYSNFLAGNYEEAVVAMEKAVSLNGQVKRYHNNLARAYFETGQYGKALSQFSHGAEEGGAHYLMGHFFYKKGMYPEAEKSFAAALMIHPEMEAARKGQEAARALAVITTPPEEATPEAAVASLEPAAEEAVEEAISRTEPVSNPVVPEADTAVVQTSVTEEEPVIAAAPATAAVELARALAVTPLPQEIEASAHVLSTASLQAAPAAKVAVVREVKDRHISTAAEGMSPSGISPVIVTVKKEIAGDRPSAERGNASASVKIRGVVAGEVQVAASVPPSSTKAVAAKAIVDSESIEVSGTTLRATGYDGAAGKLATKSDEIIAKAAGAAGGEAHAAGMVATVADHRATTKSEVGAQARVVQKIDNEGVSAEATGATSTLLEKVDTELALAEKGTGEVIAARAGEPRKEELVPATMGNIDAEELTEAVVVVVEDKVEAVGVTEDLPVSVGREDEPPEEEFVAAIAEEPESAPVIRESDKLILVRCHVRKTGEQDVTVLQFMRLVDYLGSIEIEVANASGMADLGEDMSGYLKGRGYGNISSRIEEPASSSKTRIYYSEEYLQPAFRVAKDIPGYQEMEKIADPSLSQAKIMIVIGEDMTRHAALFRASEQFALSAP